MSTTRFTGTERYVVTDDLKMAVNAAVTLARPLLMGRLPAAIPLHLAVLLAYSAAAYFVALVLTRRRLLR